MTRSLRAVNCASRESLALHVVGKIGHLHFLDWRLVSATLLAEQAPVPPPPPPLHQLFPIESVVAFLRRPLLRLNIFGAIILLPSILHCPGHYFLFNGGIHLATPIDLVHGLLKARQPIQVVLLFPPIVF